VSVWTQRKMGPPQCRRRGGARSDSGFNPTGNGGVAARIRSLPPQRSHFEDVDGEHPASSAVHRLSLGLGEAGVTGSSSSEAKSVLSREPKTARESKK
jgi:hypothetical protein